LTCGTPFDCAVRCSIVPVMKITAKDMGHMARLRRAGVPMRLIAEQHGVSRQAVYVALQRAARTLEDADEILSALVGDEHSIGGDGDTSPADEARGVAHGGLEDVRPGDVQ